MASNIEPLQPGEIDTFTQVLWDAFAPLPANMILPMLYPAGLTPAVRQRFRGRFAKFINDPSHGLHCAKDPATGDIVGIAWWSRVDSPPQTQEALDKGFRDMLAERKGGVPVEGMNTALEAAFFKVAYYSEAEAMGRKPYAVLRMLATRPERSRRGVGGLLVRRWLEEIDRLGLPAFIHAGVQAKPLYERYGFEAVGMVWSDAHDATSYGGRSDAQHWCMVRPAQGEKAV